MPEIIFPELDYSNSQKHLQALWNELMGVAREYYSGNHWQDGAGYTGPMPDAGDPELAAYMMAEIRREFTAENAVGEVTERRTNGVVSRPPTVVITNPLRNRTEEGVSLAGQEGDETADPLAEEAQALVNAWMDEREAVEALDQAVTAMTWGGRGPLRLFIPRSELIQGESGLIVPAGTPEEQAMRVYVHSPEPDEGGVIKDDLSQKKAGAYFYQQGKGENWCELVFEDVAGAEGSIAAAEGEDGDRMTVIRLLPGPGAQSDQDQEVALPLNGRLLIYEMKQKPLVTETIITLQKALNKNATMWNRNQTQAGFLETTILNAEMPGEWQEDADGNQVYVPSAYKTGAGAITSLIGVQIEDKEGNQSVSDPKVIYREPVEVSSFDKTDDKFYLAILREAHQLHYAMAGDGAASGESRITAMADYIVDLSKVGRQVERATRWMVETLLEIVAYLDGNPGRYRDLDVSVKANIFPGPIPPSFMAAIANLQDAGLYSRSRAMAELGVDNPQQEMDLIRQEREQIQENSGLPNMSALFAGLPNNNNGDQNGDQAPSPENGDQRATIPGVST